jgi:hypothetical protein
MRAWPQLVAISALLLCGTSAWAQSALDETQPAASGEAAADTTSTPQLDPDKVVSYGVGLRLRNVWIPKAMIELFVERAAGGASHPGFGVEAIRRRGNFELQLSFEFEHMHPGEGVWIDKGDNVAMGDQADYVLAPDHSPDNAQLGWFTIEFTFLNHTPFNKYVALRYGGGVGLGIITGALYRNDVVCSAGATNEDPEPGCVPTSRPNGQAANASAPVKYDLHTPVFPVVNAIIGVQIKPMPKLNINVEGGIRTFPFLGISSSYMF